MVYPLVSFFFGSLLFPLKRVFTSVSWEGRGEGIRDVGGGFYLPCPGFWYGFLISRFGRGLIIIVDGEW